MSSFSIRAYSGAIDGLNINSHINELSLESQQILFDTRDKYCLPKVSKILPYIVFRVINAVKSIFGQSDWQQACRKIATQELKELSSNKQIFNTKILFISTLVKNLLMQRRKPENDFGCAPSIKNTVMPKDDQDQPIMIASIPNLPKNIQETFPVSIDNVKAPDLLTSKKEEDSQVTAIQAVNEPFVAEKRVVIKSVNETINEAHDAVMIRLNEHLAAVRIQTAARKQFLRNRPDILSLSAFQNALRELERALPQLIIKGDYDKTINDCIEHCCIMENRVGLQRLTAYVMGASTQFTIEGNSKEHQREKNLYTQKGELLLYLFGLPEARTRDLAFVLRDTFSMARKFFDNGLFRTNLAEVHSPDSSLWLGRGESTATPEEEAARKELRELQGNAIFALLCGKEESPREKELHDLLDKAKAEKQRQLIGKVRRVQHGGGLYYLKAWCSGLRPGYPLARGKGLGIWVHPKKVDESFGDEITSLTCGYSKRAYEWFDVPAALTALVTAEHVLATDMGREGNITTQDRVHLRKPLSNNEVNPREKVFSSEEEKHVLKALQVDSLSAIDWQKGPLITDAAGRRLAMSRQEQRTKDALDSIYASGQSGFVKRIKKLIAAEREIEQQTPKYAYDLLNLKHRNLASFWMLQILHDEHGLSWDEIGGSNLHARLQRNSSPGVYEFAYTEGVQDLETDWE